MIHQQASLLIRVVRDDPENGQTQDSARGGNVHVVAEFVAMQEREIV